MKHPKFVALPFIILVVAAILSPGPTNAYIVSTVSGTKVMVTANYHSEINVFEFCDGSPFISSYVQRMIISGQSMMVPTEFVYKTGVQDLTLLLTCDGYYVYGLGSCACLTEFPESSPEGTEEVKTEFYKPKPAVRFTIASNTTGALWVRKGKEAKN